ncbi:MAG: hypothetical protein M1823_000757 [Watsoniomyces obsoletus]|nr:MAG: hypothetical protein M1823_000757 [Watsoniomyces obsoletus]
MKRRASKMDNNKAPNGMGENDDSLELPRNNGSKLKRKAKFVREGRLARPVGHFPYKRVEHAGYVREIIDYNPPRIDEDGFELDDEEVDCDADAMAAELNPYAGIKIENLLAPLTSAADLPNHPTMSKPYTSNALPELVLQARDTLQKERTNLWRMKQLFTQFRGDAMWVPCGSLETDNDAAVFGEREQQMGATAEAVALQEANELESAVREYMQRNSEKNQAQMESHEEPNAEDHETANELQEDSEMVDRPAASSIEELKADVKMKMDDGSEETLREAERQQSPKDGKQDEAESHVNSNEEDQEQQKQLAEENAMDSRPDGVLNNEVNPAETHNLENGDVQPDAMDTTPDNNPDLNQEDTSEVNTSGTLPVEKTPTAPHSPNREDQKPDTTINDTTTNDEKPTSATHPSPPPPSTTIPTTETITTEATTAPTVPTTSTPTPAQQQQQQQQQPHHMTTRLRQAQSHQPPQHPPRGLSPTPPPPPVFNPEITPSLHPLFLLPDSTRPDPNLGLPPLEAEETRRLIMMYVQKQEEVVRGTEMLYNGLLKADRMRRSVFEAAKAEGHIGEMSDGEDWVDLNKWGLNPGELRKGVDDDEGDDAGGNDAGGGDGKGEQNISGGGNGGAGNGNGGGASNGVGGAGGVGNGRGNGREEGRGGGGGGKIVSMGMTGVNVKKSRTRKG